MDVINSTLRDISKPLFLEFLPNINASGIYYFGAGGVMLGAIRHKGFIPWDTDIDIGVRFKDLKPLFDWINSRDDYYIWGIPLNLNELVRKKINIYTHPNYAQLYENRIKTYEELINRVSKNIYITRRHNLPNKSFGANRTITEIETYKYNPNYKCVWDKVLTDNNGYYVSTILSWSKDFGGVKNIPKTIADNLKKVPFYNQEINVFVEAEKYLKFRLGDKCLINGPNIKNKITTGNTKITDFSPL